MPFFVVTRTNGKEDYRVEHSQTSLWTKEPILATEVTRITITDEEATYPLNVLIASYNNSKKDNVETRILDLVNARLREFESIVLTSEDRIERTKAKKSWELLAGKPWPE